ncbi:M15 family metallopeptidase [Microbaculum marinum]|uniref:D-alanyl-D-alanine dipeptidase n=1 Tax=Microbaculum marinum TaxID=1764581 RepID=A0AAW9RZP7_9HYPH
MKNCATAIVFALLLPAIASAEEVPEGFADVSTVVPGLVVDMRYFGSDNFTGAPVEGYESPVCLLSRPATEALARIQAELAGFALGLKVFDCYRPARAVAEFVRWSKDEDDLKMKAQYYPTLEKGELFPQGYIAERSGHSRGSTVDLTLVYLPFQSELPMGTGYDFFSERSWPDNPDQPSQARANRLLLQSVMVRHGFKPYEYEWWHFTLADEPYPETYFDFPVR